MLKIGDTVKVIAATEDFADSKKKREYIPVGTICKVTGIEHEIDGSPFYEIQSMSTGDVFYYLEEELEKGHMEWIKDE